MNYSLSVIITLVAIQSCQVRPDWDAERKAILSIHEQQRTAHFEKNAAALFGDSTADYIEVNRGIIKRPTYAENLRKFKAYFSAVDFIAWDDITPPVISFSDDATMATLVAEKFVVVRVKADEDRLDTTRFAWLAVFKKSNGKWRLHRMGSTNQ